MDIYSKNKENEISAKVVDKDNNIITNLNLFNSDELNEKYDDNSSKNSAFYVDIQNLTYNGKLYIQLFLNNKLYDKIDIESVESNNYKVKIDNYLYTEIEDPVIYKSKDLVTLSNAFVKIYKKTGVLIFIISMISYIIITIITIKTIIQKKFKNLKMWIIDSGILGSILVLGLGVTLFTDWLGHDAYCFYSIGINTLIQLFEIVSIIGLLYIKKDWRKSKNEKE